MPLRRAIPFSGQVPQSLEQHVSPKPHLRNRERTFHVSPLPSTNTSRRAERRRPQLGSTRREGLDGRLLHSASPASPGLDHERAEDSRRANDGPLAESSQRHRGASRRRFPTTPYGAAAESSRVTERVARVYQQRQAVSATVSLRRIASPCAHQARGAQQCQAPAAVRVQLRLRATARATLDCTVHRCGPCSVRWSSFSLS